MKIDSNIPMPSAWPNAGGSKYSWAEMNVGDSAYFPDQPTGQAGPAASAARGYFSRRGGKIATRKEGTGVRIWRIA